jgi:bifunctional non-homologous end joining protein LigD
MMPNDYFNAMLSRRVRADGFIDPCIPTLAAKPPSGPDWVHEIGAPVHPPRLRLDRSLPLDRPRRRRAAGAVIQDGEAVVCGTDGVAIFDALHRWHRASDAMLYAFDLLELDGKDLRALPLGERKAKLLGRR